MTGPEDDDTEDEDAPKSFRRPFPMTELEED